MDTPATTYQCAYVLRCTYEGGQESWVYLVKSADNPTPRHFKELDDAFAHIRADLSQEPSPHERGSL